MEKTKPKKRRRVSLFAVVNGVFLTAIGLLCILPLVHIVAVSLSSGTMSAQNLVGLVPLEFTLESYAEALTDTAMVTAAGISLERVVLGTVITMVLTIFAAYPLSLPDRDFPGRKFYVWYLMITMLFSGGMIPAYIQVARMGLMNSLWALVIPGAVPVFNVIVLLNFFRGIPASVREAAMIDGANDFKCLFQIFLPLSIPCLATLTMFCLIGHWNAWFDGLMYMRDQKQYPLQTFLQVKIASITVIKSQQDVEQALKVSERGLISAYITLSCIPVLVVFPLLQKHIKSGLVLGSVKE